jgi:hypothetical protein
MFIHSGVFRGGYIYLALIYPMQPACFYVIVIEFYNDNDVNQWTKPTSIYA